MTQSKEYQEFDKAMKELLKVPRSEVKMKLEEEKDAKKRKRSKTSSASREVGDKV
jgi:hypothetical protein